LNFDPKPRLHGFAKKLERSDSNWWSNLPEGKKMNEEPHKFQEEVQIRMTYEQYFRDRCHETVCLAEELEQVVGREKALEIMEKAREKFIVEATRKERGRVNSFEDFKADEKADNSSSYFSHVLTLTYPEETLSRLTLHVTECLWAKVFKEMKATDVSYVLFCQPDFAYAEARHPNIEMKRTKTLMQGDSYCDHTFYWEERTPRKTKSLV
jgi:hypothetical protein